MKNDLLVSLRTALVTLLVTGLLYPLLATAAALAIFPGKARGGIVADGQGREVGAELIGQGIAGPAYLQPRPSAAGGKGYDAAGSGASNLGPTSRALHDRARKEVERLLQENPDAVGPVPLELVAASGSGLDPHLSPEAALWQAPRIARARSIAEDRVRAVIESHVESRDLLVLGEPRVNVLLVDLALDRQFGRPSSMAGQ